MKVDIDHEAGALRVGDYTLSDPMIPSKAEWRSIAQDINLENPELFAENLLSEDSFKAFVKAAKELWVRPRIKDVLSNCFDKSTQSFNTQRLREFWSGTESTVVDTPVAVTDDPGRVEENRVDIPKPSVNSAQELNAPVSVDGGMAHLSQAMQLSGSCTAREAKMFFGKSLWKALASGTQSRNDAIFEIADALNLEIKSGVNDPLRSIASMSDTELFALTEAGILERLSGSEIELEDIIYANRNFKIIYPNTEPDTSKLASLYRLLTDVVCMSNDIEDQQIKARNIKPQNLLTKYESLKELDDQLSGYSKTPFGAQYALERKIELPGGVAYLLDSRYKLKRESEQMNHCIGRGFGYASRCERGEYVAYHLIDNNGNHSTLGMYMRDYQPTGIDQHFRHGDRQPKPSSKELAKQVEAYQLEKYQEVVSSNRLSKANDAMLKKLGSVEETAEQRMKDVIESLNSGEEAKSMEDFLRTGDNKEEEKDLGIESVAAFTHQMLNS